MTPGNSSPRANILLTSDHPIDPVIRAEIEARVSAIESEHGVQITVCRLSREIISL